MPILCSVTFGAPMRCSRARSRRAFLDRARDAVIALREVRLMGDLRALSVDPAGRPAVRRSCSALLALVDAGRLRSHRCASARPRAGALHERFRARAARGLGRRAAVLGRLGRRAPLGSTLLFGVRLVPRAARVHHADAHAARRPPQPAARVLRRAADAVRARRHAPLRPVHGVHPGLRVPRDPGGQRARPTTRSASSSAPPRSSGASWSASTA